ncbi:MAG: [protein-PII] uridylyltransferase, partial [bacterium]
LTPQVKERRERLLQEGAKLLEAARTAVLRDSRNKSGLLVVRRFATAHDQLIRKAHQWVSRRWEDAGLPHGAVAIVAQGGYGRRELNFASDIDLLFILPASRPKREEAFVKEILYLLWDWKLNLGYATKTVAECLADIGGDLESVTALIEGRFLCGNESLYARLRERYDQRLRGRGKAWFLRARLAEWNMRHEKYGSSVYLLEPDVKEGEGGLRDVHTIQWLSYVLEGSADLKTLVARGLLTKSDLRQLKLAMDFLLRVRNVLHTLEGRKHDTLNSDRQPQVAHALGFKSDSNKLAEERFMQEYYLRARSVHQTTRNAYAKLTRKARTILGEMLERLKRRKIAPGYWSKDELLELDAYKAEQLRHEPGICMEIFTTLATHGLRLSQSAAELVRGKVPQLDDSFRSDPAASERFMRLLASKSNVYETLVQMHETGVLKTYLPEFEKVVCFVRIDFYHKYTVDEHLLRTTEMSERVWNAKDETLSSVAEIAHTLRRWDLLNLALLLHDVGKGYGPGHALTGAQLSQRIMTRMGLRHEDKELVRFLILAHLKMTHLSQRRDLADPVVTDQLASEIGDMERLKMLYVLTVCDLLAVSPTAYTDWKHVLLRELFDRTAAKLEGRTYEEVTRPEETEKIETLHRALGKDSPGPESLRQFLNSLPEKYKQLTPAETIAQHHRLTRRLSETHRVEWKLHTPPSAPYDELITASHDLPGSFSKFCGALSSRNINILSAQGYSSTDGFAINRFQVTDLEGNHLPEGLHLDNLKRQLNEVLLGKSDMDSILRRFPKAPPRDLARFEERMPTKIAIDNTVSSSYTLIEVKTHDRPGLLYLITSTMARHGLSIALALITTESYRVVDVFYVTDLEYNKLDEPARLESLKQDLEDALKGNRSASQEVPLASARK